MFELEADCIETYMLARLGGDVDAAKAMWRHWGDTPARDSWLSFHPSDQTRPALFTATAREAKQKRDNGIAVLPTERERSARRRSQGTSLPYSTTTTPTATAGSVAGKHAGRASRPYQSAIRLGIGTTPASPPGRDRYANGPEESCCSLGPAAEGRRRRSDVQRRPREACRDIDLAV